MEEVSIDIRMNSNVPEEAGKSASSVSRLAEEAIRAREETKKSIDLQTQYLSTLRQKYEEVQKTLSKMQYPTKEKQELRRTSAALLRELEEEEGALKTLEGELSKMERSYGLVGAQIRKTKSDMATLSAAGKSGSEAYRRLESDLRELSEAQALVNRTGQEMAKGNRSWQGLTDAVSAFAGAASAATGAWVLLGGSEEDQTAIQTTLQSLIAITTGLQQVQNVVTETSTFRIQTLAKAKQLWAAANLRVATTLGISTTAAKGLIATLTLGLSVAVTAAIALFDRWQSKAQKAAEEQQKMSKAVSDAATSLVTKYEELRQAYVKLTGDMATKQKFIDANKEGFDELGIAIEDTADADRVFVSQTDAFKTAMIARAKYTAAMQVASEIYRQSIEKMQEADARAASPTPGDKFVAGLLGAFGGNAREASAEYWAGRSAKGFRDECTKLEKEGDTLVSKALELKDEYNTILSGLGVAPTKDSGKSDRIIADRENTLVRAIDRLAQIAKSSEEELLAIELAALKEGRAKKLRELEVENERRKALLKERQKDLKEIAGAGIDTGTQQDKLKDLSDKGDEAYLRKVAEASTASDRIIEEIEAKLSDKQTSRQKDRINRAKQEYQALRQEAEAHARDKEELSALLIRIADAEQSEFTRISKEGELERLDFEEMVALRRISLSTKRYNLETEREEDLLKTELEFARKRQSLLLSIQSGGADVSGELEGVTAHIDELSRAMDDLPARKFEEMAGGLQRMLGSLTKIGGEVGDVFGSLADSVGALMPALKKGATTMDKVGSALSGVMQVADVAIRQAKANREFMEAWQTANESALQVARMQRIETAGYKEGNLFGVENPYAKAIAGAKQYAETMYGLQELSRTLAKGQVQVGTKSVLSGSNILKGAGGGAAAGAALGSIIPGLGTAIGAGIGALFGAVFGSTQRKLVPVFESLGKKYGEIYNKDTFALNPKILQDYDKLDEKTKKIIDNWDAIRKKAEEAQAQMRENFRALSGDIGSRLSEALKKGISDGDIYAAFDDFKRYASKVIYDIGEQMIFAQFFQKSFDELQERMKASFGAGGDGDIRDDIRWVVGQTKGGIEDYKRAMDVMREEMEKQGLELESESLNASRKAEARGIGRMTQDSAERLEGLMTVQVDRLSSLVTYAKQADDYRRDTRVYQATIMRQIDRIAANSDYLRKLESIASDMYRVAQEGIYIKR